MKKSNIFKETFAKPVLDKKHPAANPVEEDSGFKDNVTKANAEWKEISDRAHDYWANEVDFQINNIEDLTKDERIVNASQQDINDMCSRIAEKILNDDRVWEEINNAIEYYIYHDEFMLGAEMKESCKTEGLEGVERNLPKEGKRSRK